MNLLLRFLVSREVIINDGVDHHDDNNNIERVQQPEINHFVIGCFGDHLDNRGLHSSDHHHDGD